MQWAKFDPKPSQVGEKDKKEEKSAITPVKFYGFFSKVNQVIYSSSAIS